MEKAMSISFNSAISAYRDAANIARNNGGSSEDPSSASSGGSSIFSGLVSMPVENSIGLLRHAEKTAMGSFTKQADITDVVTAVTNAETTLKTVIAVRDRLLSAFQELEKMPI
jgi:flagellar hook-basal body complex protein FliE